MLFKEAFFRLRTGIGQYRTNLSFLQRFANSWRLVACIRCNRLCSRYQTISLFENIFEDLAVMKLSRCYFNPEYKPVSTEAETAIIPPL